MVSPTADRADFRHIQSLVFASRNFIIEETYSEDDLSKEEAGRLATRQAKFIQHLQGALVRIENKTYGVCRETGKLISKERLRAVPHATLSIEAKSRQ